MRALLKWRPALSSLEARARDWGGECALGAMALACLRRGEVEPQIEPVLTSLSMRCGRGLAPWIRSRPEFPPQANLRSLAFVRYHTAPSKWGYLTRSLLPRAIPGRTVRRAGPLRRLVSLARFILSGPEPQEPPS